MKLHKLIAATLTTATLGVSLSATSALADYYRLTSGGDAGVTSFSLAARQSAENGLDLNNCALYYSPSPQIVCAFGNAGLRSSILSDIDNGYADPFAGDGSTIGWYINQMGANEVANQLTNLGIQF